MTPTDQTPAGVATRDARALTDVALAHRLDMISFNRRAFPKAETTAILGEAARRIRWALTVR